MQTVQQILNMRPDEWKRMKLLNMYTPDKSVVNYKRDWPKERLAQWMLDNGIKHKDQMDRLYAVTKRGRAPTAHAYKVAYGSWRKAIETIWKGEVVVRPTHKTAPMSYWFKKSSDGAHSIIYIAKMMIQFDLWNVRKIKAAHARHPEIIPPYATIIGIWGRWRNAVSFARLYSLRHVLEDYCKLREVVSRWPYEHDCRRHRVNIGTAMEYFGSRVKMIEFLKELEVTDAIRKRNQGTVPGAAGQKFGEEEKGLFVEAARKLSAQRTSPDQADGDDGSVQSGRSQENVPS